MCNCLLDKVRVMCNQTGKILQVSLDNLSKENGEDLWEKDLVDGQNVIYSASDGKSYDVTIKTKNSIYFHINLLTLY